MSRLDRHVKDRGLSAHFYSSRRAGDGIKPKGKKYDYEHSEIHSLEMFNQDGMRQPYVSPHNIYETMSRSIKRMPVNTWCSCKSQKERKQASSKFRCKAHVLLHQGKEHFLPFKSFEVMPSWNLVAMASTSGASIQKKSGTSSK